VSSRSVLLGAESCAMLLLLYGWVTSDRSLKWQTERHLCDEQSRFASVLYRVDSHPNRSVRGMIWIAISSTFRDRHPKRGFGIICATASKEYCL